MLQTETSSNTSEVKEVSERDRENRQSLTEYLKCWFTDGHLIQCYSSCKSRNEADHTCIRSVQLVEFPSPGVYPECPKKKKKTEVAENIKAFRA